MECLDLEGKDICYENFNFVSSHILTLLNSINDSVKEAVLGNESTMSKKINAYYLPKFGEKLMKLCATFSVWSNVMVDIFFCPNIRASSAPVESDFNSLKNRILNNEGKLMKVDRYFIFLNNNKTYESSTKAK